MELNSIEARVLGSMMEKAKTTPEYYPLTLNALVNACNQKTSREPVTDFDEDDISTALDSLREKHLAMRVDLAGSRTAKFRENASVTWELKKEEYALLTVLLLRGPQTPGQLRQRTERLYPFAELPQVSDWLQRMQERDEEPFKLVQSLGRTPGGKEIRYAHTLIPGQEGALAEGEPAPDEGPRPDAPPSRMDKLEASIQELQGRIDQLEKMLNEITS